MNDDDAQPRSPSPRPAVPRPKVLFLWDESGKSLPELIALNLDEHGIDVTTVHTRDDALQALARQSFCALFLNVISAIKGGGAAFIQELKRDNNPVPVVVLTAAVRKKDIPTVRFRSDEEKLPWSIFAMVSQPATIETLVEVIHAAVRHAGPRP